MLFLQFMLYSSSFVGTLVKNVIPEAALELCQLDIKQLSPNILKFRTKHEHNQDSPFTLNCFVVSHSFLFIFNAGSRGLGSNNFGNSSYKEKKASSVRVSRLHFLFLWLCSKSTNVFLSASGNFERFRSSHQRCSMLKGFLRAFIYYLYWYQWWCH